MEPVSARWDEAIRTVAGVVARVEVWRAGVLQATLTARGGAIRADETSAVRRALTIGLADLFDGSTPLTLRTAGDLLAPFGSELRVWAGRRYSEGDVEYVPVGCFPIAETARERWLSGLSITAPDRGRTVALSRLLSPVNVAAGEPVTTRIRSLISTAYPAAEIYDLTGSRAATSDATLDRGEDPWDAARSMASSIGAEVHVDPSGRFLVRPVPTGGAPVWSVDIHSTRGALLDLGQRLSAEGVFNIVVATSSTPDAPPVSGYAYVSSGPLSVASAGPRPMFWASPIGLTTTDRAIEAARSMLPKATSRARVLTPDVVPNPALDVGDPILLSMPDEDPLAVTVSGFTLPLGVEGRMRLDVRYPGQTSGAESLAGVALT